MPAAGEIPPDGFVLLLVDAAFLLLPGSILVGPPTVGAAAPTMAWWATGELSTLRWLSPTLFYVGICPPG